MSVVFGSRTPFTSLGPNRMLENEALGEATEGDDEIPRDWEAVFGGD